MLEDTSSVRFVKISAAGAVEFIRTAIESNDLTNCIGHADTNHIVSGILGIDVGEGQRVSVKLTAQDICIVAQYTGPRLPEGATMLPEGAKIEFWHVHIVSLEA